MVDSKVKEFTLITGASKGIGRELAIKSAKEGMNLILVARTEDKLKSLANELSGDYNIEAYYYAVDLIVEGAVEELYKWSLEKGIFVNMLINNAGFGLFGEFHNLDIKKQLEMIDLNIKVVVELTNYFLAMIKKAEQGYILNVGSMVGLHPVAYSSVYAASKSFVISFTESIREELKDYPIKVSCLCPGSTKTNFFDDTKVDVLTKTFIMEPEVVAQEGIDSLLNRDKGKIFPKWMKLAANLPNFILKRIVTYELKRKLDK